MGEARAYLLLSLAESQHDIGACQATVYVGITKTVSNLRYEERMNHK